MKLTFEQYKQAADYLRYRVGFEPEIAIVLGTGLGSFAEKIENPIVVAYCDIPYCPISTVSGHAGKLVFGTVSGKKVVCMAGRFHFYEGYDFQTLAYPVRLMKLLGVKKLILTNAAGAINTTYKPGDVVLIYDHIKFFDDSPLRGENLPEFGPRFFDMTYTYPRDLREKAKKAARQIDYELQEGVYFYFPGPQFETPAEIRAARILGGDLVGMSTVPEAITASHCSMPVLAMSLVSNMAAGVTGEKITAEEVDTNGLAAAERFCALMSEIVKEL